jgi:hypothetical protein
MLTMNQERIPQILESRMHQQAIRFGILRKQYYYHNYYIVISVSGCIQKDSAATIKALFQSAQTGSVRG